MNMKIDGIAAVTGAGRGIGLATAIELAHRGFDVLALVEHPGMVDDVRDAASDLRVTAQVLDVTAPGSFEFPAELSVLVNNAGTRRAFLPVEHVEDDDWRGVFDVNFFGLVEVTRRAIRRLRERRRGVICNVTSSAVLDMGPFFGAYRCSKVAASALCEELRVELAPFGVRVVEILPGPTSTVMARDGVSARIADAADYPAYQAMAVRQRELLSQQPPFTSVEEVGRVIAEAILDDDGPMRYGTDTLSRDRLQLWRNTDDERLLTAAVEKYGSL